MLNEKQREKCLKLLESYQDSEHRSKVGGMTFDEWYNNRVEVGAEIRKLIQQYLTGKLKLSDFRWEIDSANKLNNLWGFNAWKGQFYFNMILKVEDSFNVDIDRLIKDSIREPKDDDDAISKMERFYNEVENVAATYKDRRKGPNPRSTPYFLSYFWQIQNLENWPIHYPSTESALETLGLWNKTGDTVLDAKNFIAVIRAVHSLFNEHSKQLVELRIVGHAIYDFYLKQKKEISKGQKIGGESQQTTSKSKTTPVLSEKGLPDKYIPPVVSILPQMACIDPKIEAICKEEGIDLPTEFEKRVAIAFRLIGFDVERRGQGTGREPDIIATSIEHRYAIILDAKARKDSYRMGTEDRKFSEYIKREIPKLRKKGFTKYYFGVVSSKFHEKITPSIKDLRIKTEIHGVGMFEAEDLLLALDLRLRSPEDFELGENGFMRLLTKDGVISKEDILQTLGN